MAVQIVWQGRLGVQGHLRKAEEVRLKELACERVISNKRRVISDEDVKKRKI